MGDSTVHFRIHYYPIHQIGKMAGPLLTHYRIQSEGDAKASHDRCEKNGTLMDRSDMERYERARRSCEVKT